MSSAYADLHDIGMVFLCVLAINLLYRRFVLCQDAHVNNSVFQKEKGVMFFYLAMLAFCAVLMIYSFSKYNTTKDKEYKEFLGLESVILTLACITNILALANLHNLHIVFFWAFWFCIVACIVFGFSWTLKDVKIFPNDEE